MAALRVYLGGDTQYVSGTVNGVDAVWTLADENLWQTDALRPPDDRYIIHLEAYDFLGRMTAYDWTGYYGDGALIWHHTRLDYLNADDLNRIETATAFLRNRLAEHSYLVDLTCRTDWSCTDFPTRGEIDRIRRWDFPSPYPMRLRICRFQLDIGEFETIATSLPRSFSLEDIKEIYRLRWKIETSFNFLKHAVGLVNLHGRSDAFCEQEIYAALTMFNFASRISREVVIRQPKDGMYAYKVNFKMAVALCREYFRTPGADGAELMRQIAKHAEAIRPGRHDTRKLKAKSYTAFVYRVAA